MNVILLVLILYRCRLLKRAQICAWLVAELNFELSDYVNYDTQCTYIDNDFHFYYHIV